MGPRCPGPCSGGPAGSPLRLLGIEHGLDESLAAFALAYADQNDRDYQSFLHAVRSGRIQAEPGR